MKTRKQGFPLPMLSSVLERLSMEDQQPLSATHDRTVLPLTSRPCHPLIRASVGVTCKNRRQKRRIPDLRPTMLVGVMQRPIAVRRSRARSPNPAPGCSPRCRTYRPMRGTTAVATRPLPAPPAAYATVQSVKESTHFSSLKEEVGR